eukprot:CAMPEP_0175923874 /NCGR_PEP_ID=MMETSP0108-20121206/14800_1 /TAXON_ID=195067 ORGANISM="Goniomonas pacifica, Strain CCMP1869" /NCGR_SAMPLE_ID=MMETSP0108 /ASSEMBLY_ACC=CAM_ASM_000204 /LENGTH=58 /DNA_ID=CAMNT_0017246897 /DNA_START=217 /DNA_END=393 /DNA_ORIENTATION=+
MNRSYVMGGAISDIHSPHPVARPAVLRHSTTGTSNHTVRVARSSLTSGVNQPQRPSDN